MILVTENPVATLLLYNRYILAVTNRTSHNRPTFDRQVVTVFSVCRFAFDSHSMPFPLTIPLTLLRCLCQSRGKLPGSLSDRGKVNFSPRILPLGVWCPLVYLQGVFC